MTNETIQLLLDALNGGVAPEIIIRPIGKKVWWGFVWPPQPAGQARCLQEGGYEMFFVQAAKGEFVAAVFWHGPEELHWYVAEKARRKGIFVKPLRAVILPFIFHRHKCEKQSCSVECWVEHKEASMKLAKRVGFQEVSSDDEKTQFEIRADEVSSYQKMPRLELAPSDLEQLKLEAELSIRSVRMVIDNLRVRFAEHITEGKLENLLSEFNNCCSWNLKDCIEDARWSLENKT